MASQLLWCHPLLASCPVCGRRLTSGTPEMDIRSDDMFLGFDPGGRHGFGVALVAGTVVSAGTLDRVADAMAWATAQCGSRLPIAAGIDTLLHWSDAPGGWRPADKTLRTQYPRVRSSVVSANSLYGAMSIGGIALALRLRQQWPSILLNETHPKVMMHALGAERYKDAAARAAIEWFARHSGLDMTNVETGHELDAVLSAWATRCGIVDGWGDLVADDRSILFPAGKVSYLWLAWPTAQQPRARLQSGLNDSQFTNGKIGASTPEKGGRARSRGTTQVWYVNRNGQEVIRPTGHPGTDHGQYVYVLRCRSCGREYGANGSDIFLRRCPAHDRGAPGLAF